MIDKLFVLLYAFGNTIIVEDAARDKLEKLTVGDVLESDLSLSFFIFDIAQRSHLEIDVEAL